MIVENHSPGMFRRVVFLFMLAISLVNYARVVQVIGYLVGYKDLMDKSLFGCSTHCLEKGHSGI